MQNNVHNIIIDEKYSFISSNIIGKGSFGVIYKGEIMKTKEPIAIKEEKSTNKNRTFVLFSCFHLYTFKKMSDIIGTVTRTNSKNMTEPEPGIIRYFRVLFYPQKSVL